MKSFFYLKNYIRTLYRKLNYSWSFPIFFKYFLISNQLFSRKWYLNYLPTSYKFDSDSDLLRIIKEKALRYFNGELTLPAYCEIIDSSIINQGKLKLINNSPAYRYLKNPLIAIPEFKDFLLGENMQDLLSRTRDLKIVGINLRISEGTNSEEKTTCFHRDFNGFQTIKLFIPLLSSNESFLEYFPNTVIKNPLLPIYSPKHIPFKKLSRRFKNSTTTKISSNIFEGSIVNTSCIHREMPSKNKKITIIITILPHLDYGKSGLKINEKESVYFNFNAHGEMVMRYLSYSSN